MTSISVNHSVWTCISVFQNYSSPTVLYRIALRVIQKFNIKTKNPRTHFQGNPPTTTTNSNLPDDPAGRKWSDTKWAASAAAAAAKAVEAINKERSKSRTASNAVSNAVLSPNHRRIEVDKNGYVFFESWVGFQCGWLIEQPT
jgi:hypothetical protein